MTFLLLQLPDGGHAYAETNLDNFIVEPWNAISSLAIVFPAVYWAIKTMKNIKDYAFIWFCIPLLFLNGLGSTLFHAFRSSGFLLLMDVLPAALLTLGVSIYFWYRITKNVWVVALIILAALFLRSIGFNFLSLSASTNISYLVSGIVLFSPILIFLKRNSYFHANHIILSIASLIIALVFRTIDKEELLPLSMGTHFLWHILCGFGGYFLALYLYEIRTREINLIKDN